MYHALPSTASFWAFLLAVDQDLAETTRNRGCPCGGRLHQADYPRKPRADSRPACPLHTSSRFSFCCDRDGCRKRATPPSARFLGRKVYVGAIVVLISAMRHGPTPRRVRELSTLFGVDRTTIARWQTSGANTFPRPPSGRSHGARLHPPLQSRDLAALASDAFLRHSDDHEGWGRLLRFLSPITTADRPAELAFPMTAPGPQKMPLCIRGWPTYRGYRGPFTPFVRRRDDPNTQKFDRRPVGAISILRRGLALELSPCAEHSRQPSTLLQRRRGVIL